MAEQQVLLCPVCGKSGPLWRYSIDEAGAASGSRVEHEMKIALRHRNPQNGRVFWTHHEAPLRVLVALRQQMVEALGRLDGAIAEAADGE